MARDLEAAVAHHRAGRLDRAAAGYRKILNRDPSHCDALNLLGLIALDQRRADHAAQLIARAIAANPGFADAHNNLGSAHRAAGRLAEAEAAYRQSIALAPKAPSAYANLARALHEQKRFVEAEQSAHTAIALDPRSLGGHVNLAIALRGLRRLDEAEAAFRAALALAPDRIETLKDLATLLGQTRQFGEAVTLHEQALRLRPDDPELHAAYGETLVLMEAAAPALEHFKRAVSLEPQSADLLVALSWAERALGRFDASKASLRRALELQPEMARPQLYLAQTGPVEIDGEQEDRLRALLDDAKLDPYERVAAGFALGKRLDSNDRFDDAFAAFAAANALYRSLRASAGDHFDAADFTDQIDSTIGTFPAQLFDRLAPWGDATELPVFVCGMPRSGTSLVEQIAASHSRIFGAGELAEGNQLAERLAAHNRGRLDLADWDRANAAGVAADFIAKLRVLGNGALRVIDKTPDNVVLLGVLALLFPGARVVLLERDLRDVCLSNFFQYYPVGNLFAFDLADCGIRARETERIAEHWLKALPLRIIRVSYEALVADLEGQSRRLIDFLGMPWEPQCLDFHRTERMVATMSMWQVRQPIYDRSVGRWRHYEQHLAPMLSALQLDANQ
jgi:tetratricopeptide (TPR) repeat protein